MNTDLSMSGPVARQAIQRSIPAVFSMFPAAWRTRPRSITTVISMSRTAAWRTTPLLLITGWSWSSTEAWLSTPHSSTIVISLSPPVAPRAIPPSAKGMSMSWTAAWPAVLFSTTVYSLSPPAAWSARPRSLPTVISLSPPAQWPMTLPTADI